jgi:hypothetical protein
MQALLRAGDFALVLLCAGGEASPPRRASLVLQKAAALHFFQDKQAAALPEKSGCDSTTRFATLVWT